MGFNSGFKGLTDCSARWNTSACRAVRNGCLRTIEMNFVLPGAKLDAISYGSAGLNLFTGSAAPSLLHFPHSFLQPIILKPQLQPLKSTRNDKDSWTM